MADTNKILITTVSSNDYPRPVQDKDGRWVVSASAINRKPNKAILYDSSTSFYTDITPYSVSKDYYKQVVEYENNIAKQHYGWADPQDDSQINSFVDLPMLGATGEQVNAYMREFVLNPLTSKDPFTTKAGMALNNLFVNFSETIDLVTGSNTVKGLLMNGTDSITNLNKEVDNGIRKQYNWNVETGNNVMDTVSNIMLELITDPSNWITLGASSAIKSVAKSTVPDLITKASTKAGFEFTQEGIESLTKVINNTYLYGNGTVSDFGKVMQQVLSSATINKTTGLGITEDQVRAFATALRSESATAKGIKTMNFLNSLHSGSDLIQQAAGKAVAFTSTLGLGYTAIKSVSKVGNWAIPYMTSVLNGIAKNTDLVNATLLNLPEVLKPVQDKLQTLGAVIGLTDNFALETIRVATHDIQFRKYEEARKILTADYSASSMALKKFNEWSQSQGAADGRDLFKKLLGVKSIAADDLRGILKDLQDTYNDLYYTTMTKTIQPVIDTLNKTADPDELKAIFPYIESLGSIGIDSMDTTAELRDQVKAYISASSAFKRYNDIKVPLQSVLEYKFDFLKLKTIFNISEITEAGASALETPAKSLSDLASRRNEQAPTAMVNKLDPTRAQTILTAFTALKKMIIGTALEQHLIKDIDEVLQALSQYLRWVGKLTQDMPLGTARNTNIALKSIQQKLNRFSSVLQSTPIEKIERVMTDTAQSIGQYSTALQHVVDTELNKITNEPVTNIYNDAIIDKAAKRTADKTLKEAATMYAQQMGAPSDSTKDMFIQISNIENKNSIPFEDNGTYQNLLVLADTMEHVNIDQYYINQLGLYQFAQEWMMDGFTIDLGSRMLNVLDDAISHVDPIESLRIELQMFRDEIDSLVTALGATDEALADATEAQLNTSWFTDKLSQIQSTGQILSSYVLQEALTQIRDKTGIGALVEIFADDTADTLNSKAASILKSLSKSTYVANRIIELVDKLRIPDELKQGVYDALASKTRAGVDEIYNAEAFAIELLNSAKIFIDNKNNAHPARLSDLSNHCDPIESVINLYNEINVVKENQPEHVNVLKQTTDPQSGELIYVQDGRQKTSSANAERLRLAVQELLKDDDSSFNVVYSATQTGYQSGTIVEYAYILPDGSKYMIVNSPGRQSFLDTLDEYTARKLYGKSVDKVRELFEHRVSHEHELSNVVLCNDDIEFAKVMFEVHKTIKDMAIKSKRTPRLVGFNNGMDSLGTDKLLSKFFNANKLNVHLSYNNVEYKSLTTMRSFDAAQWIRIKYDGALVLTDNMYHQMTRTAQKIKNYLEQANSNDDAPAYLMPDFTTETTAAIRELQAAVSNAIEYKNKDVTRLTALSKEQYNTLMNTFNIHQLVEFQGKLNDLLFGVGTMLTHIRNSNEFYGQWYMVEKATAKLTKEYNVYHLLTKLLGNEFGVSSHSLRKRYDPEIFNEWFDIKYVQQFGGITTMPGINKLYEVAERLQRTKTRIKQPMLIAEVPTTVYNALIKQFIETLNSTAQYKYNMYVSRLLLLRLDKSKANLYLIARAMWGAIRRTLSVDELQATIRQLSVTVPNNLFALIEFSDDTVFYGDALYTPGLEVLHSELVTAQAEIMRLISEVEEVTNNVRHAETIEDALRLNELQRENLGYNYPGMRMKEEAANKFVTVIKLVKDRFDTARINYYSAEINSELDALTARREYTSAVKVGIEELKNISMVLANRRAHTIMTLPAQNYAIFLYKFAQGIQVFDMEAAIFKSNPDLVGAFMKTLKDAQDNYGVRYINDISKHELIVYLDDAELSKETDGTTLYNFFETVAPTFKINTPALTHDTFYGAVDSKTARAIVDFFDMMDQHFDGVYSISMHRTTDSNRYRELIDYIPKNIRGKVIPKNYLYANDMIDGIFNQNIMGDYTSGVGSVFSVYSGNIITNIAAGFNTVFNRMHSVDLYTSTLFNYTNSVHYWWDSVQPIVPITRHDLIAAMDNVGYTAAKIQDGKVTKVDLNTDKVFDDAIKGRDVVLLDYQSYTHAVEVINDNHIDSSFYHFINKNYFALLKYGMIMSPGTILRNLVDSTLKSWLQSGSNMSFFGELIETKRIMGEYYKTLADIFEKMDGKLTNDAIEEYYSKELDFVPLNKWLFRSLLNLYNSTSASPMAAQLNLMSNTTHRLYMYFKGDDEITEKMVENAVDIFTQTAVEVDAFKIAYSRLINAYGEDIADKLITLYSRMPKDLLHSNIVSKALEKFPVTKYMMRFNNDFEVLIRTHTFLETNYYKAGTIGQGLKATDFSQFNRARDTKPQQLLEMLFPFSSFQIDNAIFWTSVLKRGKHNVLALIDDVTNGMYDEEQIDTEEMSRNMSLQYLFLSGNLILDEANGEVLKLNGSLNNTLQMLSNPYEYAAQAWNVPVQVLYKLATTSEEDMAKMTKEEWTDELLQLAPLVGVIHQRYKSAWSKKEISDAIAPLVLPSVFGIAKLDSNIPVGYDWFNQTAEYKSTHRFVYGVSYVPAWMKKDPSVYVNTYQRLLNMGYSKDAISYMMQDGWYFRIDGMLRHYTPYQKKTYAPYIKKYYVKRPKQTRKFNIKVSAYQGDKFKVRKAKRVYIVRRIYRQTIHRDRYAKTGLAREQMINWRGANRSSRQLLRDRTRNARMRQQRIARQVKPLR